jgi:hypothetical protein
VTDKEKMQVILEGISLKMKALTSRIQKTDVELEVMTTVAVNDDILDDIRIKEVQLENLHADRNALWNKFKRLTKKVQAL